MPRKTVQWLIYFYPDEEGGRGSTWVEPNSKIPKKQRHVDSILRLPWPFVTKKGTEIKQLPAKLIAKSTDENDFNDIHVDAFTGNIIPSDKVAFSQDILAKTRVSELVRRQKNQDVRESAMAFGKAISTEASVMVSTPAEPSSCGANVPLPILSHRTNQVPVKRSCEGVPRSHHTGPMRGAGYMASLLLTMDEEFALRVSTDNIRFIKKNIAAIESMKESEGVEGEVLRQYFNLLLQRAQAHHQRQCDRGEEKPPTSELLLPSHFSKMSPGKVTFFPNQAFYITEEMRLFLNTRTMKAQDWRQYVDIFLSELYKEKLQWLSALGKRNSVGLHPAVFKGLCEYASKEDRTVTEQNVAAHINGLISNRRGANKRKMLRKMRMPYHVSTMAKGSDCAHRAAEGSDSEGPSDLRDKSKTQSGCDVSSTKGNCEEQTISAPKDTPQKDNSFNGPPVLLNGETHLSSRPPPLQLTEISASAGNPIFEDNGQVFAPCTTPNGTIRLVPLQFQFESPPQQQSAPEDSSEKEAVTTTTYSASPHLTGSALPSGCFSFGKEALCMPKIVHSQSAFPHPSASGLPPGEASPETTSLASLFAGIPKDQEALAHKIINAFLQSV